MYIIPFGEKIKLWIAEKKMGLMMFGSKLYKKNPGYQNYIHIMCFREFCNYRTRLLIKNGGGKKIISKEHMISIDESILINLDNFCIDGQSVHPDVIYNTQSSEYIMAISQFPYKNDAYEIPIILYSKDTINWYAKGEHIIKVNSIPNHFLGYHSDPGVLAYRNKLWFFDRKVIINKDGTAIITVDRYEQNEEWCYRGTLFSVRAEWDNHEKLLSPTMVIIDNVIHCWHAERRNKRYEVIHNIISPEWKIVDTEECIINGLKEEYIWHLDVCVSSSGLFMAADIKNGNEHSILLLFSVDKGKTWNRSVRLAWPENGFSEKSVYRGSIVTNGDDFWLFYSGRNYDEYWQTAQKKFIIDNSEVS